MHAALPPRLYAVCTSLPPSLPGIAAWPSECKGSASCTAECLGNWTGTVIELCGTNKRWLPPKQNCIAKQPGG